MSIVILRNELPDSSKKWELACDRKNLSYTTIDLTSHNWFEQIRNAKPSLLLLKPSGLTAPYKELYDERIRVLVEECNLPCYPSVKSVLLYENKRFLSFWLKSNDIDHPETFVFYKKQEASHFANNNEDFPIVAKTNIGASGSGVTILKSKNDLELYIYNTFSGMGAMKRRGPNLKKGGLLKRGFKLLLNPKKLKSKIEVYEARAADIQKNFILLQEFIPHDYEWRVVRIGKSFFAHKKLIKDDKTSGSLEKSYENPPVELFEFVRNLTDTHDLDSVSIDLFYHNGIYLVNEIQCIFGQSDSFQMKVNETIGRYTFLKNNWVFEAGDFNTNESYDLRLSHALLKHSIEE
ncbi:MAG: hypothetical protein P8P80_07790 [Crocinitomicaceae bacterium]|nr:hypothetical protein [Crocinitomicaceae bacterium]MDG1735203.1 hypothetical protein [Crocinitomicaceae bacterium]MDG2506531.1 hypothetical protein [Crocinitomicaceae bacterium]